MSANPLYPALLAAQAEFGAVVKNQQNPHLRNWYADLSAVLEAVTDPLANHGLLIVQRFASEQGAPVLITELIHAESGQSISSSLPIVSKDPTDPQKLGGAITYARRYSLLALLGLSPEDDDGNAAAQPRQQQSTNPRTNNALRPAQQATAASAPPVEPYTLTDFWRDTKQAGYDDPKALAAYLGIDTFKGYAPLDLLTMFRDKQKGTTR
jgi:hypothetical protein